MDDERIIKHRVIIYDSASNPVDVTPYVINWNIENGGVNGGSSGLDGVVKTASITLKNSIEDNMNFNPEAEMGIVEWNIQSFIGDGGSLYGVVPNYYLEGTPSFNLIQEDYENLYGEITVVGTQFKTPKPIPVGVAFEIACRNIDYTSRNPINTVGGAYSPLLDENVLCEIYSKHENIKWMSYEWLSNGDVFFPNPTPGTPLINAIAIMDSSNGEYTNAIYDGDTDSIVLSKPITAGTILKFSISYFIEEPEQIFKGYLGDNIAPNPQDGTISLSFRDEGKLLQDCMIDGVFITVDPSGWVLPETPLTVQTVDLPTDTFYTAGDHNYKIGDSVIFKNVTGGTLPKMSTGQPAPFDRIDMNSVYVVSEIPSSNSFKLQDVDALEYWTGVLQSTLAVIDVDVMITNILNDCLGINAPDFTIDITVDYNKRIAITTDIWESKTCWDAIQHCATINALYLSFLWIDSSNKFELVLKNLVDKTTADVTLTKSNIYAQTQTSTGNQIRNAILVSYYDASEEGSRTVSAIDPVSIGAYGIRPSLITEANTSGINSSSKAQQFADLILEASKDKIVETVIEMPFFYKDDVFGRINIGDTLAIEYTYLDNNINGSIPFFVVESYSHSYDSIEMYKTIYRGNRKKVRTAVRRFKAMESRPGAYKQQIGRDLSERYKIPAVEELEVFESGLESIALTPRAYAVIRFRKILNYSPSHYILEYRKTIDNPDYSTGQQIKIIGSDNGTYSERIKLDPKVEYKVRVTAWSRGNVKGVISNEITINEIGDDVAPIMPSPSGLSLAGLDEGLQIKFNAIEDTAINQQNNDFLAYNIYLKRESPPTKLDYNFKKTTQSSTTIYSGLGLYPGLYYAGITAYDTSGNESDIVVSSPVTISPTIVIRTQAELTAWYENLPTVSTTDYNISKIRIYKTDSPYLITVSTIKRYIKIPKIVFEFIGDVELVILNFSSGGVYFLNIDANSFEFLGNPTVTLNNQSSTAVLNFIDLKQFDTSTGVANITGIYNSVNTNGTIVYNYSGDMRNSSLNLTNCSFNEVTKALYFIAVQIERDSSVNILNCSFYSSFESRTIDCDPSSGIYNMTVSNSRFINSKIRVLTSGVQYYGISDSFIIDNTFIITTEFTEKNLISMPVAGSRNKFSGNVIKYEVVSGLGGYTFVDTNNKGLNYSIMSQNMAYGVVPNAISSWVDNVNGNGYIETDNTTN